MMKKSILSLVALVFLLASCNTQSPNNSTTEAKATDAVKVEARMPLDWSKNANIYEVNVRQYTPEGTFSAFAKELPRLKEMGVDILWFMHRLEKQKRNSGVLLFSAGLCGCESRIWHFRRF